MAARSCITRIVGRTQGCTGLFHNAQKTHVASFPLVRNKVTDQSFKLASVEIDQDMNNLAIVKMKNKPVNSLSTEHLAELHTIFKGLNEDKSIKAMILTSGFPGIFSAGLDITCMYNKTKEEVFEFWTTFQNMWIELYGSRLITAAAINGQSPAGGCLLAMSCDMRFMAEGKFTIGLNETKLGIVAPFWMKDCMENVIGFKETERALMLGSLFSTEEALKLRLIDQVLPIDNLIDAAKADIKKWMKIPDTARYQSKQMMRKETLTRLTSKQVDDANFTVGFLSSDQVQKALGLYLAALAQKKK